MRVGASIPNDSELPRVLGLARIAEAAERAGAASLWVSDHLLMLDDAFAGYPYTSNGLQTTSLEAEWYEALTCCALIAGVSRQCRIGTAVLVLPQRNVLEVAKMAASIDQISGGRLSLGIGIGWYRPEIEALGYSFEDRTTRFNEMVHVLRDCWTIRPRPFTGKQVTVPPNVILNPPPAQENGPPLLVGGMTDAALRRAARYGDGWLAVASMRSWDHEVLRERIDSVLSLRGEMRGASDFQTVLKLHADPHEFKEMIAVLPQVEAIGFDEVIVDPPWAEGLESASDAISAACDAMRRRARGTD